MFITFEGIEGSGKTTQIQLLAEVLRQQNQKVILTREPGGTFIGQQIRQILLDSKNKNITPATEILLYCADRAQHVQEVLQPSLQKGSIVISDRFFDATLAYQAAARNISADFIYTIHQFILSNLKVDLTFLLDLPVEEGLFRAQKRASLLQDDQKEDRFEQESLAFHQKVRDAYLHIASQEPQRFCIISAQKNSQEMHQDIVKYLQKIKLLK